LVARDEVLLKSKAGNLRQLKATSLKKVILSALEDLEKAWQSLIGLKITYQRSEINPQFVQLVPPTDVVIVSNFEIESGIFIWYYIRLHFLIQHFNHCAIDYRQAIKANSSRLIKPGVIALKGDCLASKIDLTARLGSAEINAGEIV